MPRKTERFNRLIEPEVAAASGRIAAAHVVVGIPFFKEAQNLADVVRKAQADLHSLGAPAAIVVVGERKTRNLLFETELPDSTDLVKIVRFAKPFGFGQKPGLSRRSWAHWAILRIADRLHSDVVFIDADVRNTQTWVDSYLRSLRDGADIAVANYIRSFGSDDAMVHIWDRLIFGALFNRWIEFRQGGDYALSKRVVPAVLRDPLILREAAYTLDSAVMAHVAAAGGRIDFVWLGRKEHEPIDSQRLFKRLPDLVQSVFDDIDAHLPAILALRQSKRPLSPPASKREDDPLMRDLVGERFRHELRLDAQQRKEGGFLDLDIPPKAWAKTTFRFLIRYLFKASTLKSKRAVASAYVPELEAGVLAFLNRTEEMRYEEAMSLIESEYLPAFQKAWRALARRRVIHRASQWRLWPGLRQRYGSRENWSAVDRRKFLKGVALVAGVSAATFLKS